MTWKSKGIGVAAVLLASWVGAPHEADASYFSCYHNGSCQFQASCEGDDYVGLCYIQCFREVPCDPPQIGGCWQQQGTADCGNST